MRGRRRPGVGTAQGWAGPWGRALQRTLRLPALPHQTASASASASSSSCCCWRRRPAQMICKPGSFKGYTSFEAEVYALTKEEGGRHTPFTSNYQPQFFFRTADVTGEVKLPDDTPMIMPGDSFRGVFKLILPVVMEPGLR